MRVIAFIFRDLITLLAVLSGEGLHPVIRHKLSSSISSEILISNVSIVNGSNKDGLGNNGGD